MQFPVEQFVFNNVDNDEMRRGGGGGGGGGLTHFHSRWGFGLGLVGEITNNDRVADEWKQTNSVLLHLYNCIYKFGLRLVGEITNNDRVADEWKQTNSVLLFI